MNGRKRSRRVYYSFHLIHTLFWLFFLVSFKPTLYFWLFLGSQLLFFRYEVFFSYNWFGVSVWGGDPALQKKKIWAPVKKGLPFFYLGEHMINKNLQKILLKKIEDKIWFIFAPGTVKAKAILFGDWHYSKENTVYRYYKKSVRARE